MTAFVARPAYLRCLPRQPLLSSLRFSFKSRTNTPRRVNLTSRFSCAESLRDPSESSFENFVFLDRRDERIVLEDFRRSPPCNVRAKRQPVSEQPTCYAHFEQPGSSFQSSFITPPLASSTRHRKASTRSRSKCSNVPFTAGIVRARRSGRARGRIASIQGSSCSNQSIVRQLGGERHCKLTGKAADHEANVEFS